MNFLCKSSKQQDAAQGYDKQLHKSLCTWPDNGSSEIFTLFYIYELFFLDGKAEKYWYLAM